MLSIIIPASNEAALIGGCLAALLASDDVPGGVEVIVAANGCQDDTAARARRMAPQAQARGWALEVLDLPAPGKLAALNAADSRAQGDMRAYLDADVTVTPALLALTVAALARPDAAYASGRVNITAHSTWASRAYARIWRRVPFMRAGVPGCGYFAVNAAGRARWGAFPAIISDDTFVRLQFTPAERHLVAASYDWPIAEGFGALVRVRRRQDAGVAEVAARWPALMAHDGTPPLGRAGLAGLALRDPLGFVVYAGVALRVRLTPGGADWTRGR
ncbi:MAG: glycosyltransferase [Rhodobacterales bacterium]|nr:glycosyltransferase [Rhodobacterales bacterium]NCT11635.1 glycosyltransferase [Rhodobacterales bacterium]